MEKLRPYIVGIDPGRETGYCIWNRQQEKLMFSCTTDFLNVQKLLLKMFEDKSTVKIYVEVPGRFVYRRNTGADGRITKGDSHAVNIGMNIREAQLLVIQLEYWGFDVEGVAPVREKKWTAQQYKIFTKSDKKVSQHEADAVRLAFYYANKTKR